jgi:type II site-specific deoxyribonuclease
MSNNDYSLSFISQEDFENHVKETLETYDKSLNTIDLASFNSNIVDPIKLLFDKEVFHRSFEETISFELQRQRDKSNTNAIGYFHQNMFKYIDGCRVPDHGWDVIVDGKDGKIYVEMKNKHNTMNSSSTQKTYMRMQNQILTDDNCICMLVEAIAPVSRDISWGV